MKKILYFTVVSFVAFLLIITACESDGRSEMGPSGKGGSLARFAINNNTLYAVSSTELKVFDMTETENPNLLSGTNLGWGIETIFPYGNNMFIGTQTGMQIYDISDPLNPVYVSQYEHIFSCDPVVVEGDYAYVTLNSENSWCGRNSNLLQVIDISDLSSPQLIKQYNMASPKGLGVDDSLLFVCDNVLKVFDITDKRNLRSVTSFNISAYDLIPNGDVLIVIGSDGLYQYSYANGNMTLLSKLPVTKKLS